MADLKISQLTVGTPAQSGDLIPIDRAGANFSLTAISIANLTLASPTFTGTVTIPTLVNSISMTTPSIAINGGTAITGQSGTGGTVAMVASPTFTGTVNVSALTGSGAISGNTLVSTVATGTAPLTVASTTNVPNLNASSLSGATFASPAAIGTGTPAAGTFTALTATGALALSSGQVLIWGGDTAISRDSSGVFDFGTGAQGNKGGTINATTENITGTSTIGTAAVTTFSGTPNFSGAATGQTAAVNTNTTQLATTAYVDRGLFGVAQAGWKEDFFACSFGSSNSVTTTQANFLGDTGWTIQAIAATGSALGAGSTYANPGLLQINTGATSGNGIAMFKQQGSQKDVGAIGSNAGWQADFIFKISSTSTISIRLGFCQGGGANSASQPTDGIFMEYDTANTGNTDTDFTWVTVKSGASTTYSTTNAIAANTNFNHLRIRSTSSGTILFSINGGTEASVATNVPTATLALFLQLQTRTSGAAQATYDFVSYFATPGRT